MSKQKISVTIDEAIIENLEQLLVSGKFRNRSHVIEYSLKKFMEENEK